MTAAESLLVIQQHDTAMDRLRHRRDTLPERADLEARTAERVELDAKSSDACSRRDDVAREEQRLDDESQSLAARVTAVEKKMYSGEISSPRELQAMQADVEQLSRHRSEIDDRELERMEQRELLDTDVAALDEARAALQAELDRLTNAVVAQEAEIDAEIDRERLERAAQAAGVPEGLLATYERCRARARGVGAAKLIGDTCQGCHLSIPSTEIDRMRHQPPDTIAHCDNCGCILVLS